MISRLLRMVLSLAPPMVMWFLASTAMAQSELVLPPLGPHVTVVWTDDDQLLIAGNERVAAWDLSGEPLGDAVFVRDVVDADGSGRGAGAIAVVVGSEGELARFREGRWERDIALVEPDASVVAVAVDDAGIAYVPDDRHALHEWRPGGVAAARAYPSERADDAVVAVAADASGAVLLHRSGALTRYRERTFSPLAPPVPVDGRWVDLWIDPSGGVWRLTDRGVVVDPAGDDEDYDAEGCARLDGTGLDDAETPLLVLGCTRHVLLVDDGDAYVIDDGIGRADALSFAPTLGRVFVRDNLGLYAFALDHPGLGGGAAPPRPRRDPPRLFSPFVAMGGVVFSPLDESRGGWGFDAGIGGFVGLSRTPWSFGLWPTAAFSHSESSDPGDTGNYFVFGLGPGVGTTDFVVAYRGELVVGRRGSGTVRGWRHGGWIQAWNGILGLEVSRELVYVGDNTAPSFRALVAINPLRIVE